jgi:hypothetical protein
MPASISTTAPAVERCFGLRLGTAACSVPMGPFLALPCRPTHPAAARRTARDRQRGLYERPSRLGARSARVPHLGHTRCAIGDQPRALFFHCVAHHSHVHGRDVLAQRPPLRSDPLLFHRTVLPGARGRRISVWRRRAATGHTGMVEAVLGFADRERGAPLPARTVPRPIPASVLITYFEWNLNYWYHRSREHARLLQSVPSNGS